MKEFRFRLDQVLKWRASQVEIEKSKLAVAEAKVVSLRSEWNRLEALLTTEATGYHAGTTGMELGFWEDFRKGTLRRIADLRAKERLAEAEVAACRQSLTEANRRHRLLENLKDVRRQSWMTEWNREMEAFAAEAFLARLRPSQATIGESTGA